MRGVAIIAIAILFLIAAIDCSLGRNLYRNVAGSPPPTPENFVVPFTNSINAQTGKQNDGTGSSLCTAAVGNGSADDTAALQSCINALDSTHSVLYMPAGTYKITAALVVTNKRYVSIVGATPAPTCSGGVAEAGTVCIVWGGAANSKAMLDLQGFGPNSSISRITLNGNNNVGVLVNDTRSPMQNANNFNQYADMVFINAGGTYNTPNTHGFLAGPVDYACGFTLDTADLSSGGQCSEITLLRDSFTNGGAGIYMGGNGNSLDAWVWYSTFTNKTYAVFQNNAGDYHLFNNNFFNSSQRDLSIIPNGNQDVLWNYSVGANLFMYCQPWKNTGPLLVQGNTVLNTTQAGPSIECDNQGPLMLIDNLFSSCTIADGCGADATAPVVYMNPNQSGLFPADLVSTGNQFTVGVVNTCTGSTGAVYSVQGTGVGRCTAVGDSVVAHTHPSAPALPPTPPQYCASGCPNTVSVTEITAGASTATIQSAINAAAALNNGSVVHLQAGSYTITATLSVPGNGRLQIIGDGLNTQLTGSGLAGGPVISCGSACKAWIRDMLIDGGIFSANGIRVAGADQAGGRVFFEQGWAVHNNKGILANGLASSNVEMHDSTINDILGGDAINVVGASGASSSYTKIFAFLTSCNNTNFVRTSAHANFLAHHVWQDLGGCAYNGATVAQATGSGTFTWAGSHSYVNGSPATPHYFNLTNMSGVSAVLGVYTYLGLNNADELVSGSTTGNHLSLGYGGCHPPVFTDSVSGDSYLLLAPQTSTNPGGCNTGSVEGIYVSEGSQNISSTLSMLNTTLAPLRSVLPVVPGASGDPAANNLVTDARVYRVLIQNSDQALDVEP